jgi:hypothetical protein
MQTLTDISYRQGDILLMPCPEIPSGAVPEAPEEGLVVLAHGETSGHRHVMNAGNVAFFREDGSGSGGFVKVTGPSPVDLSHEEHAPLAIPPGNYRVVRQREYQPQARPRRVMD